MPSRASGGASWRRVGDDTEPPVTTSARFQSSQPGRPDSDRLWRNTWQRRAPVSADAASSRHRYRHPTPGTDADTDTDVDTDTDADTTTDTDTDVGD